MTEFVFMKNLLWKPWNIPYLIVVLKTRKVRDTSLNLSLLAFYSHSLNSHTHTLEALCARHSFGDTGYTNTDVLQYQVVYSLPAETDIN